MSSINLEKIYKKAKDIKESTDRLKAFRKMSLDEFLGDRDNLDIAGFRLIVATEAAIDICLHIAAKTLKRIPEDYAGCFSLLAKEGLIEAGLAERLSMMARFRNLIVHQYWDVDYKRVYAFIMGREIEDLEVFLRRIQELIDSGGR